MSDELIAVPGSSDTVVLLDYTDGPNVFANLIRVTEDGTEIWRATPPGSGPDAWTQARVEGDEMVAHSWSGFMVRLDLATGAVRESIFTK